MEGGRYALIVILNRSNEPVYQVIVSIVAFQGPPLNNSPNGNSYFRGFVSVVPPGRACVKVNGGYRGMGFHPGVEVAFVDKANRSWVRSGQGTLIPISEKPQDYYGLYAPLGWQLPQTLEIPESLHSGASD